MARHITTKRFKALTRKGDHPTNLQIRKDIVSAVEKGPTDRTLRYTISTEIPDREGDVVSVDGWDLTNFRKNPVVLWAHNQDKFPIGRCIEIGVEDGALKATVEFAPADIPHAGDHAEAAFRLSSEGFLPGTSVGFRPLDYDISNERAKDDSFFLPMDFKRQELLEFSLVSVPCNPDALLEEDPENGPGSAPQPSITLPENADAQARGAAAGIEKNECDAARRNRIARQKRARQAMASIL
ncbi:HK97 family phage prohead protease [Acetobacter sp.]|uniref:HK97 family phage prohead protease n=1 Tax=Acetobacter sp. TaxID=440 RepID=UPI0039EB6566